LQEENQNFTEFSRRTEALATKLGCRLVDLPNVLGISRAMLFAYRRGQSPISGKAWRKLEAAERAAGIGAGPGPPSAYPPPTSRLPSADLPPPPRQDTPALAALAARLDAIESRLDAIESRLDDLINDRLS
jgi:hypothetical protein